MLIYLIMVNVIVDLVSSVDRFSVVVSICM